MNINWFWRSGLALVLVGSSALASVKTEVLKSSLHEATVSVDSVQGSVTVRVDRPSDVHPSSVQITFYGKDRDPLVLTLRALPASLKGRPEASAFTGTFANQPLLTQQSYVGLELSIPLPGGKRDILRNR